MRYKVEDYYDSDNRHVREFIIFHGEPPEDFSRFVGLGAIQAQVGEQLIPRQFKADLEVETINEAFEVFDEKMKPASEEAKIEFQKELEEQFEQHRKDEASRIVIPG